MYPFNTRRSEFSQETLDFVLSSNFGSDAPAESHSRERLGSIAGLAFDLLVRVQKTEKLRKLGQLGKTGDAEYDSNIRLAGLMLGILKAYQYQDHEMMDSLEKKYLLLAPGIRGKEA